MEKIREPIFKVSVQRQVRVLKAELEASQDNYSQSKRQRTWPMQDQANIEGSSALVTVFSGNEMTDLDIQ
jgi:hypothetical protein